MGKAVIEFVGYVETKISNAFHSVTGSEEEWRFPPQQDISADLEEIKASLQRETEAVRRQEAVFGGLLTKYDGQPLADNVRWERHHRAALKKTLDGIIREEDCVHRHLKAMCLK